MTRARRRDARQRRHGLRFRCSVEEEVADGIVWQDDRHVASRYLLPAPGAAPEAAASAIRTARAVEIDLDEIEDGTPGIAPTWPHWVGLR